MEDIVNRLRSFKSAAAQSWAHEAATEIESLRAQLAEAKKEQNAVKCLMDCYNLGGWTDSIGVTGQLLATQAHAARLVEAFEVLQEAEQVFSKARGGPWVQRTVPLRDQYDLRQAWDQMYAIATTPINLDALFEHDAQLLRGTAEKWKGVEGVSPYEFLINEASAYRAKKNSHQ